MTTCEALPPSSPSSANSACSASSCAEIPAVAILNPSSSVSACASGNFRLSFSVSHSDSSSNYYLSDFSPLDECDFLEHLNATPEVSVALLSWPYPYTSQHFFAFLNKLEVQRRNNGGYSFRWAIRKEEDGRCIGSIGLRSFNYLQADHKADIGYWLAKKYWKHGIVSAAIACVVQFAFTQLKLIKVAAAAFVWNKASHKVLQKNGFIQEGILRKQFKSIRGTIDDGIVFGLLVDDWRKIKEIQQDQSSNNQKRL